MRSGKFSIANKSNLAIKQLDRNLSVLPDFLALLIRDAKPVKIGTPYLITYESVEIDRITDFQWSPYYAGTFINALLQTDPVVDNSYPSTMLASCCIPKGKPETAVFPIGIGLRTDAHWSNEHARERAEMAYCGDRVFHLARYTNDRDLWVSEFSAALDDASNAGSFDVGFCTLTEWNSTEWSEDDLAKFMQDATKVVATALDGDGYILWEYENGEH